MKALGLLPVILVIAIGCGGGDEFDDAREQAYAMTQDTVRSMMKIPKSTYFPEMPPFDEFTISEDKKEGVRVYEHDSVTFTFVWSPEKQDAPTPGSAIVVSGPYESQNPMGAMMPGGYAVMLSVDDEEVKRHPLTVMFD